MSHTRLELNNPCPYCDGKTLSSSADSHFVLLPLEKGTPPSVNFNEGLPVVPITCTECGYVMLFRSNLGK